jgi:hypothetical protein
MIRYVTTLSGLVDLLVGTVTSVVVEGGMRA